MKKTSELESELAKTRKYSKFYFNYNEEQLRTIIQPAYLQILIDFDKICRENNIFYVISAGTLLGAVREKGWIPWDDDIDVLVTHSDYDKLHKAIIKSGFADHYCFMAPEEGDIVTVDGKFLSIDNSLGKIMNDPGIGHFLYIDVLPIENVPDNKFLFNIKALLSKIIMISYNSLRCLKQNDELLDMMSQDSKELRSNLLIRRIVATPARIIGKEKTYKLLQRVNAYPSNHTRFVTVPLGVKMYKGEIRPREVFFPATEIEFEGHKFKAPIMYKDYLRNRYGEDYLTPPTKYEQGVKCFARRDDWRERVGIRNK